MVWDAAKKEGLIVDAKKRTVIVMPWPEVKSVDARKMFEGTTVTNTGKSDVRVLTEASSDWSAILQSGSGHRVCVLAHTKIQSRPIDRVS